MKIEKIAPEFRPSLGEMFFLDTNVWLYLFYPQSSHVAQPIIDLYSNLFKTIAGEEIQTNLVQMSEIINTIIRAEFRVHQEKGGQESFKQFRESTVGQKARDEAKNIVTIILKHATLRDGSFAPDKLNEMIALCDKADFNDIYFFKYAEKHKLTLVSHDFDFRELDGKVRLISANKNYFK
jgi:predicted nucleic acid-binding protein